LPARSRPAQQSGVVFNQPTALPTVRTQHGTDKDRFFLFSQLAAAFRSGLNPVNVFSEVSQRSRGIYHESLEALAKTAIEGGSLSRTMARYPDLYPEHVVGLTEAGQQGGFLPDAFEQISLQAQAAHKFKRWFFWIWFVFVNTLFLIPGMWWACRSLVASFDANWYGNGGATPSVGSVFAKELLWPIGPAFILLCLACWALYAYFGSRVAKRFRHKMGLRAPVYGKRAKHENLSIFSWSLARLSYAGLAPATAYRLAADTAPNLEMRDEFIALATRLSGAEKMSQIIGGSNLFPEEYAPLVATAEYTGDLPGAFQQLSEISRDEFKTAETYAKMRSGCWGMLAFFVVGGIAMAMLCYTWYRVIPDRVLKEVEWLTLFI
jgi:type IV pilus assembly protein PilC